MRSGLPVAVVLAFVLRFLFLPSAYAAIYQWTDDRGVMHITDYPKPVKQAAEPQVNDLSRTGSETGHSAPASAEPKQSMHPAADTVKQTNVASPPSGASKNRETAQPGHGVQQTIPSASKTAVPVSPASSPPPAAASVPLPVVSSQSASSVPAASSSIPMAASAPASVPSALPPAPAMAGMPQPGMSASQEQLAAMAAGLGTTFLLVGLGLYIFTTLCLYLIASKLNVTAAWTAFIPILQVWPLLGSAGKPCWWVLLFLIPVVNWVLGVYIWICISENMGRNKWLGLLSLVPFGILVLMPLLAFTKKEAEMQPAF